MSDTIKVGDRLVIGRAFAESVLAAYKDDPDRFPEVVRLAAIHDWEFGKVLVVETIPRGH